MLRRRGLGSPVEQMLMLGGRGRVEGEARASAETEIESKMEKSRGKRKTKKRDKSSMILVELLSFVSIRLKLGLDLFSPREMFRKRFVLENQAISKQEGGGWLNR